MRIKEITLFNHTFYLKKTSGKPELEDKFYFGEDIFLLFNDPNNSTFFGSLTKSDLKKLRDIQEIKNMKAKLQGVSEDESEMIRNRLGTTYQESMSQVD